MSVDFFQGLDVSMADKARKMWPGSFNSCRVGKDSGTKNELVGVCGTHMPK